MNTPYFITNYFSPAKTTLFRLQNIASSLMNFDSFHSPARYSLEIRSFVARREIADNF